MNNLHYTAISKHKPNPSLVLGIGNFVRSSNAVCGTSKIKNSLAKNKAPWGDFYITKSSTIHADFGSIVQQKYNGNKHTKGVYTQ